MILMGWALLFALSTPALAESKKAPAKTKAATKKQVEPQKPLEEMTCGDLTFLLGDDKRIDDATYLMIWAYGIKTGAEGSDLKKNPFDAKHLEAFTKEMIRRCNEDSEAKFVPMITAKEGDK
jgi:hypothetical protein